MSVAALPSITDLLEYRGTVHRTEYTTSLTYLHARERDLLGVTSSMSGTSSDDDDLLAQFNASAGALESRLSTAHFSIRHLVRNDAATHDDEVEALTARVPPDSSIPRDASPAFAAPARQRRNARHPAWSSAEHDALAASLQRAH